MFVTGNRQLQEEREQIHQGFCRSAKEAASWMKREVDMVQSGVDIGASGGSKARDSMPGKEKGRGMPLQVHPVLPF